MNFIIEEKQFDISILKCINEFTLYSDVCFINESTDNVKSFKEKVIDIFQKVIKAIKDFIKNVKVKIQTKFQQIKLNKKLEELKDILAKKKAKALNKKFNYFDIKKYKSYYKDFINRYVAELKKGLNTEFKSIDEYEKWRVQMENKLSDFNFKLSDEEQWKLSVSVNSAVNLTETEVENREKNLKMVEEEGSGAIKNLENYYRKLDTETSMVNYGSNKLKIYRFENTFIGRVVGQLAKAVKTVTKFIVKHTFLSIGALIMILIAL